MKILVTGGAGFLGSHVADELTKKGHDVIIFDNSSSPYINEKQKCIIGDITDYSSVEIAVENVDVVYHFAGISDIDECKKRPLDVVNVNILGTTNILEACVKHGIKRFIFASSAYVFSKYGYFYKTSKSACENLIENYNELFGLNFTCIRYGSLYGDRADAKNSIYRILKSAILHKEITYYGSGDELREYIHVTDASKISVEILDEKYKNQSIIITGTEKFKYKDLLEMINEILGGDIKIIFKEKSDKAHYTMTPYSYNLKMGTKVTRTEFIDFGQGILNCLDSIVCEMQDKE